MQTIIPSSKQQEALNYATSWGTLVNWHKGTGKTTFLAMFAYQCLQQYDNCVLVYVAPTRRQCVQLDKAVGAITFATTQENIGDVFMMSMPEHANRISGLHNVTLIVLMDECQSIDWRLRTRLRETIQMIGGTFRVAQTATLEGVGPAVF